MYTVTASQLNLRSTPEPLANLRNWITTLPNGQEVEKLAESTVSGWWQVSTILQGTEFVGFVNSNYLSATPTLVTLNSVSEVHLSKTNPSSKRGSKAAMAYPLGEPTKPNRDISNASTKVSSIKNIIDWLDVENSIRYKPGNGFTYCNIYAHDFCFLNGVYIPRVWWTEQAIIQLTNGNDVPILYGQTVTEKNANSLLDWLKQWGQTFGWERVNTMSGLQQKANDGQICLLVAKRRDTNRSGHIVAIVPENTTQKAKRNASGVVTVPLQSQAGATNFKYSCSSQWWLTKESGVSKFSEFVMFSHA